MCSLSLPWFPFPPDSGSPPLSRHGSPAWLFDWLVCIPRWRYHAVKPTVYKKKTQLVLSHSTFCSHAAPVSATLLSSPGESILKAEMWWPYTLTTYKMHDHSQLHQNKSVSLSEWRACSPNRTIQVLNDSRLLIWASNHTDTSLSWVMEKWAWWKKIYMLMECGIRYFFPTISSG